MSVASRFQAGLKTETAYGTNITVTKFFACNSDIVIPQHARLESAGIRPGLMQNQNTMQPYKLGAQGTVSMEVANKGFGIWGKFCLGSTVSTTGPSSSYYTHTFTMADLQGTSFTWQDNRPTNPTDADLAHTFYGGKVMKYKFENAPGALLMFSADLDFQDYDIGSTALATASYPSSPELLSFIGATISLGGTNVDLHDFSLEVDNSLDVNRRYLRGSVLKKEPIEGIRKGTWTATADHSNTTQLARIQATTSSTMHAAIVATWADSASGYLKLTIPAARFDEGFPTVANTDPLKQPLKGSISSDGTNSPVTFEYKTLDSTP